MSNTTNCEFCGRYREPLTTEICGKAFTIYKPCECEEARSARRAMLLEEEKQEQAKRKKQLESMLRKAGIPERYLGAEHDMAQSMADSVALGKGYYIDGPQGTGKTHLAYAVARICIGRGIKTACISSATLMEAYRSRSKENGDLTKRLMCCRLLVIDDLGKESPTQYACERLFEIVDTRYNSLKPIVVTSNYSRGEIARKLTEGDVGKSIASRLSEMTQRIRIDGEDRRLSRG